MDSWKEHGDWHIRENGRPINLNTEAGVQYVMELRSRLRDLQERQAGGRRRKKAGPRENKDAVADS